MVSFVGDVQFKRGAVATLPAALKAGEPWFGTDAGAEQHWIGNGAGTGRVRSALFADLLGTNIVLTPAGSQTQNNTAAAINLLATRLDAVIGGVQYIGPWDATANNPAIPTAAAANKGHYYVVTTAGTTTIGTNNDWQLGDWVISNGAEWSKVDNTHPATGAEITVTPNATQTGNTAQAAIDNLDGRINAIPAYTAAANEGLKLTGSAFGMDINALPDIAAVDPTADRVAVLDADGNVTGKALINAIGAGKNNWADLDDTVGAIVANQLSGGNAAGDTMIFYDGIDGGTT